MVTRIFIRSIADVGAAVLNARVTHLILTTFLCNKNIGIVT